MTPDLKRLIEEAATDALRAMIWLYRHSLSYFVGRNCRFLPTCSAYADEAIKTHGPIKGTNLALRRFCRCHPFQKLGGGQGFDPVPPHVK
jgi:putative membrane protein insertion efficiency factor